MTLNWIILLSTTLMLNVGGGFMRCMRPQLTWRLLWIHLPIPVIVWLRWCFHVSWKWIPILVLVAVVGQLTGGIIRKIRLN